MKGESGWTMLIVPVVCITFGIGVGIQATYFSLTQSWQKAAINRGVGTYDDDGEFRWTVPPKQIEQETGGEGRP